MGDAPVLSAVILLVLLIQSAVISWLTVRILRLDRDARRSMAMLAEHADHHRAQERLDDPTDEIAARRRRNFPEPPGDEQPRLS